MKCLLSVVAALLLPALFLFMPSRVVGEDIEISFEAQIYSFDFTMLQPCLGEDVGVGTILKGTYIYDTDADDTDPEDEYAHYDYYVSPYGIQVKIGSQMIKTDPENVDMRLGIYDGYAGGSLTADTYFVESFQNLPLTTGGDIYLLKIYLYDEDGNAIGSVDLKTQPPVLSDWNLKIFQVVMSCGPSSVYGQILAHIISMERVYPMDDLVDDLRALLKYSPLKSKQGGLVGKLASASAKFDREKDFQACQQLQAFICQFEEILPMFEPPYDDDAEDVLEQAEEIFGDRCENQELESMECPMSE